MTVGARIRSENGEENIGGFEPQLNIASKEYARTHTRMHARTHARTHTHTHTHTLVFSCSREQIWFES